MSSIIPTELRYTESHEWVRANDDGTVTVGITDHAQHLLGDLVFVEIPEVDRAVATAELVSAGLPGSPDIVTLPALAPDTTPERTAGPVTRLPPREPQERRPPSRGERLVLVARRWPVRRSSAPVGGAARQPGASSEAST